MRPFVFLDRDGTLVEDHGYTHRIEDYRLLPGVADGLRRLADAGFALAIVTNQSGIGRGYYGEDDFHAFQRHLLADLALRGLRIESSFFCPHLPDEACACRKPAPGLLVRAAYRRGVNLSRCWMIGDILDDVEAGRRAGCRTVLVDTGGETEWATGRWRTPHHVARDLGEAAALIVRADQRAHETSGR